MTTKNLDSDARVAALENEMRLTREQHAAEMSALRDDIRAARERHGDARDAALETIAARIEQTSPAMALKKEREETTRRCDALHRQVLDAYRSLLAGERGFYCICIAQTRTGVGGGISSTPDPIGGTGRLVYAASELEAREKYITHEGINRRPPPGISTFADGTFLSITAVDPAEADQVRRECLAIVDEEGDEGNIRMLMHRHALVGSVAEAVGVS